jgi:hypothetical protein
MADFDGSVSQIDVPSSDRMPLRVQGIEGRKVVLTFGAVRPCGQPGKLVRDRAGGSRLNKLERHSSIVSFYIREESPAAEKILEEARVKVSLQNGDRTEGYGGTSPVTRVRVSLSFFNNAKDVDRFLEVSEKLGTT